MKKFIQKSLAICLLFSASFSYATDSYTTDNIPDEVCSSFKEAAGGMMAMRQYERPITEAMEIKEEVFNESQGDEIDVMFNDMLNEIILHAYSIDVAPEENQKIRTITGFANSYYSVCMQELIY